MYKTLKAQAGMLRDNLSDLYLLTLITVGLPLAVYLFTDGRYALATFVVTQIAFMFWWKRNS